MLEDALLTDWSVGGALEPGLRQDLRRGQRDLVTDERTLLDDLLLQERVLDLVGDALVVCEGDTETLGDSDCDGVGDPVGVGAALELWV